MIEPPRPLQAEGPRRIVRLPLTGRFMVLCDGCRWGERFDEQVDAQAAFDLHACAAGRPAL